MPSREWNPAVISVKDVVTASTSASRAALDIIGHKLKQAELRGGEGDILDVDLEKEWRRLYEEWYAIHLARAKEVTAVNNSAKGAATVAKAFPGSRVVSEKVEYNGDPLDYEVDFGKYRGKTLGEIVATNHDYPRWVVGNLKGKPYAKGLVAACEAYLAAQDAEEDAEEALNRLAG